MPIMHRAEEITIVGDEDGFELHLTTEGGLRYVFNVHAIAENLLAEVNEVVGGWLAEGRAAAASYRPVTDDADAYPADSPKHPAYHSTHADIWDAREGK